MLKIAVIVGSTRPNRVGRYVADWVLQHATHNAVQFELVDIQEYNLPLLDEPQSPAMGKYAQEHTKRWAAKIAEFDAFIFVAPEYNHGINAALKNALDFIYKEWNNKAAAFISYGSMGGARSVEHLRQVMAELMIADIRAQVMFSLATDFENYTRFKPDPKHEKALAKLIEQLVPWAKAMKQVREMK